MTIAKILFAMLVCVPLLVLFGSLFSKLVDEAARKNSGGKTGGQSKTGGINDKNKKARETR